MPQLSGPRSSAWTEQRFPKPLAAGSNPAGGISGSRETLYPIDRKPTRPRHTPVNGNLIASGHEHESRLGLSHRVL